MVSQVDTAFVELWGMLVGAVAWNSENEFATFEFDPEFLRQGLDLAPLRMPLADALRGDATFEFRTLPKVTFKGLPGMLADSLPDKFGNDLINAWLARQGRTPESFNPVERLCYTGKRAMGALEFTPVLHKSLEHSVPVEVGELIKLVQTIADKRADFQVAFDDGTSEALLNILRVGTSAGGTRPKAILAVNDETNEVRSGQVDAPDGFDYWVLKFDGVQDASLGYPAGYGRIEYAYHLMALKAGIKMTECRLLEENGRAHFMTKRFDRQINGGKLHLQSLCAIAHFDFNNPGAYSYEQAFQVNRELKLPYTDMEQLYRRMVLNIVARNQDDHTKNIAYLMDKNGKWRLSPAFDVIWAYNPEGIWTRIHQMSINGKRAGFVRHDLIHVGVEMGIKDANHILNEIVDVVSNWSLYAEQAGVEETKVKLVGNSHRLFQE